MEGFRSLHALHCSNGTRYLIVEQVNVKGLFNIAQSFLPNRNPGATLIGINTRTLQLSHMSKGFTAYNSSKIAALKVLQTLADENPDLHVVAMHPGVSKALEIVTNGTM